MTQRATADAHAAVIGLMLTRYIREAMKRARFKTLSDDTCFGKIPGLAGVWANEATAKTCAEVLQEVLAEWLVLKIRDNDPIPRLGRVSLSRKATQAMAKPISPQRPDRVSAKWLGITFPKPRIASTYPE